RPPWPARAPTSPASARRTPPPSRSRRCTTTPPSTAARWRRLSSARSCSPTNSRGGRVELHLLGPAQRAVVRLQRLAAPERVAGHSRRQRSAQRPPCLGQQHFIGCRRIGKRRRRQLAAAAQL